MSPTRLAIGLLIAILILAAEFLAYWYFNFPAQWIPFILFAVIAAVGGVLMEIQTRKALRPYWERACTGFRWRRRFPDAPKTEIREFLKLFVNAFGIHRRRRLSFSPEDKVMDVYHAVYPPGSAIDGLELETFCKTLKERYGVDLATSWRQDVTLGEIYEQTRRTS